MSQNVSTAVEANKNSRHLSTTDKGDVTDGCLFSAS